MTIGLDTKILRTPVSADSGNYARQPRRTVEATGLFNKYKGESMPSQFIPEIPDKPSICVYDMLSRMRSVAKSNRNLIISLMSGMGPVLSKGIGDVIMAVKDDEMYPPDYSPMEKKIDEIIIVLADSNDLIANLLKNLRV